MATATTYYQGTRRGDDPVGDGCVPLWNAGWKGYRRMLCIRGERPRPRIFYLDANLYLVTTSFWHESLKHRLGRLIWSIAVELETPFRASGSTTFWLKEKDCGVEGDETYYFAHHEALRGKTDVDLRTDPPPDLAVEVVGSFASDEAIEAYRRLGVPEVWVWEDDALRILVLQSDGAYAEAPNSASLPLLTAAEVSGWVNRRDDDSDTHWAIALRRWACEVLVPRARREQMEGA